MKKFTFLLISLTFIGLTTFAQDRLVLVEQFTSSTCGPCNPGNANVDAVLASKSDYTVVKYQMSWPGSGDPYYTQEGGDRRTYYGVNSVPNLWVDGQWGSNSNSFTGQLFDAYAGVPTFMDISINTHTYDPSSKAVEVEVDVESVFGNTSTALRLMVAVVENKTTGNIGSNGETEFHYVFMKFLGGSQGTTLNVLGPNETVTKSFSGNMTGTFVEEMDDLKVVAWVEDIITKKIWNSNWHDLQDVATVGIDEMSSVSELSIYPNPAAVNATIEFDLEDSKNIAINVYDMTGKVVQSVANTTYSVGNHKIEVDGSKLNSGIYYVNIIAEDGVITKKLILDK